MNVADWAPITRDPIVIRCATCKARVAEWTPVEVADELTPVYGILRWKPGVRRKAGPGRGRRGAGTVADRRDDWRRPSAEVPKTVLVIPSTTHGTPWYLEVNGHRTWIQPDDVSAMSRDLKLWCGSCSAPFDLADLATAGRKATQAARLSLDAQPCTTMDDGSYKV